MGAFALWPAPKQDSEDQQFEPDPPANIASFNRHAKRGGGRELIRHKLCCVWGFGRNFGPDHPKSISKKDLENRYNFLCFLFLQNQNQTSRDFSTPFFPKNRKKFRKNVRGPLHQLCESCKHPILKWIGSL